MREKIFSLDGIFEVKENGEKYCSRYVVFRYLLIVLLVVGACSASRSPKILNADPMRPSLLIAVEKGADSAFKQELISLIRAEYSDTYLINVKTVKKYRDLEGEQYSAVIVMDMLKAWLWMNKGLKDIIKNCPPDKAVYFLSTGDPDWKWDRRDIKLVTSATTKKVKAQDVFDKLKAQLAKLNIH